MELQIKYLLLIFLTTGMDVERFDSLKDCQVAAEMFTVNYCKDWGYFQQTKKMEKPIDVFHPKIKWLVCGKDEMVEHCSIHNPENTKQCTSMPYREWYMNGVNQYSYYEYRAGCFRSTK